MTPDEIKETLRTGPCVLSFVKVNGETRTMTCTLHESFLPETPEMPTTSGEVKKISPDVVRVFCLDNSQWRSFRWQNLVSLNTVFDLEQQHDSQ